MDKPELFNNTEVIARDFKVPGGSITKQSPRFKSGHWLLLLLGALCLMFIVFISLARSIQLTALTIVPGKTSETVIADAKLTISSLIKLPIGNRILLLPGKHVVDVQAAGFHPVNQEIEVGLGRHQQFEITLEPLPGKLDIQLNPSVGAKLMLNGEEFGQLPGIINAVPAGQHEVTIDASLYRAATRSVIVRGKGLTEDLEIDLEPAWANLSVDSIMPSQAKIFIDDKEVGVTPLTIKVEEGNHSLRITAEKFKPYEQNFTMVAQQDIEVPRVTLLPADGILEVQTNPDNAAVIVNGEYQGTSPITINIKPQQIQKLQVYKAGFRLQSAELLLQPEQQISKKINLLEDLVSVRFSLSPSNAELIIDGVLKGTGSQTITMNTLPHKISVRKAGYVSKNRHNRTDQIGYSSR